MATEKFTPGQFIWFLDKTRQDPLHNDAGVMII